jgi:tetratricopeptide (TPR) repeat protein
MLHVRPLAVTLAVSFWLSGLSPTALAQSPSEIEIEGADRLFKEALGLIEAGRYEQAAQKLEQSQRLAPGSGTLLNLADCYERLGRNLSAWKIFLQAAQLSHAAGKLDRERVAMERAIALRAQLGQFIIELPAMPGDSLRIILDGRDLPRTQWSAPIVVEPGPHRISASAPGRKPFEAPLASVEKGGTARVRIPELSPTQPTVAPELASPRRLDGQQLAAIIGAGVGVVGLGAGAVFALRSQSKHEESDRYCIGSVCSDPRGVDAMEEARSAGDRATLGVVIGAIGFGAAAALWFVRPLDPRTAGGAELAVAPGQMRLQAKW